MPVREYPSLILDLRVGPELGASLSPRPVLGFLDQGATDSTPLARRLDIPSLHKSNAAGDTTLRIGSDRQLDEPDGRTRRVFSYKHG